MGQRRAVLGSETRDAIAWDESEGYVQPTDRAVGFEGASSTWNVALPVAGVTMKPLATPNRPLL